MALYQVELTLIYNPVTEQIEEMLAITDPVWWVAFLAFLLTPEASCSNGCEWPNWDNV